MFVGSGQTPGCHMGGALGWNLGVAFSIKRKPHNLGVPLSEQLRIQKAHFQGILTVGVIENRGTERMGSSQPEKGPPKKGMILGFTAGLPTIGRVGTCLFADPPAGCTTKGEKGNQQMGLKIGATQRHVLFFSPLLLAFLSIHSERALNKKKDTLRSSALEHVLETVQAESTDLSKPFCLSSNSLHARFPLWIDLHRPRWSTKQLLGSETRDGWSHNPHAGHHLVDEPRMKSTG